MQDLAKGNEPLVMTFLPLIKEGKGLCGWAEGPISDLGLYVNSGLMSLPGVVKDRGPSWIHLLRLEIEEIDGSPNFIPRPTFPCLTW